MKTIILLDYDSLNASAQKLEVEINSGEFLSFLKSIHEESEIQTAYAYVGINEKLPHVKDKTIDELIRNGYIVRKITGDNYGINFVSDCSQAITFDALRSVYENEATNVILVSSSHKLENLVMLLREKDISVETVFYGSFVDYDLAVKSTGFINLEDFICDDNYDEDALVSKDDNDDMEELDDNDDLDDELAGFEDDNEEEPEALEEQDDDRENLKPTKVNNSDIVIIKEDKGDNE